MADLFLALGVIFNSISVILLHVDDLKAANRLRRFCDSMDSSVSFGEYVSRVYGESKED